jgi:hypothetical protein
MRVCMYACMHECFRWASQLPSAHASCSLTLDVTRVAVLFGMPMVESLNGGGHMFVLCGDASHAS